MQGAVGAPADDTSHSTAAAMTRRDPGDAEHFVLVCSQCSQGNDTPSVPQLDGSYRTSGIRIECNQHPGLRYSTHLAQAHRRERLRRCGAGMFGSIAHSLSIHHERSRPGSMVRELQLSDVDH